MDENFGKLTREEKKTINKENNTYLHFVKKWYENKTIKYESNKQEETIRKNRVLSIKAQFENKIEHAILDTGSIKHFMYRIFLNKKQRRNCSREANNYH